jgi:aminoglycoside 6'-N-acetyltransferase
MRQQTSASYNQDGIKLRCLSRDDFPHLLAWINAPHVARWWDDTADIDSIEQKYGPRLSIDSPTKVFIIEFADRPLGMIQCYRHADYPEWDQTIGIRRAAGIDYLIGDEQATGKGIGSRAIRAIADIAFAMYADIDLIVSAPQKDNMASCRALEKAGFVLAEERKLESDCPSDAGLSRIYTLHRQQ